ncbi:MerC domain-containing protein [Pseudohalocynthiibacter sp. F2068]|uniref:MerC domain-containing protein n=1 Tax=Pseudohalocynthiibacter sp. F2068 TaxID=2926418 RepID=UPI001FF1FD06|nr:MerC domain-containing protein [Pseudohalocynthiibacter sp. F2068]MCK0102135.1 MerC family mercury resistance protein [Pseudohalocynthiibacter sp. F2068]
MPQKPLRFGWFAGVATVLSVVACYGSLVFISALGALGIAIHLNETLWAGAIVLFAILALFGFVLGLKQHKVFWPIVLGIAGTLAIIFAMYVRYDRLVEITGFVLLFLAAIWDWRIRQSR